MPEELANVPELPETLTPLWNTFLALNRARGSNGFGPNAFSYVGIDAYCRLNRVSLDQWELDALLQLDAIYLNHDAATRKVKD